MIARTGREREGVVRGRQRKVEREIKRREGGRAQVIIKTSRGGQIKVVIISHGSLMHTKSAVPKSPTNP